MGLHQRFWQHSMLGFWVRVAEGILHSWPFYPYVAIRQWETLFPSLILTFIYFPHCQPQLKVRFLSILFVFWLLKFLQVKINRRVSLRPFSVGGPAGGPITLYHLQWFCFMTFALTSLSLLIHTIPFFFFLSS